jgi:hypothetical protein
LKSSQRQRHLGATSHLVHLVDAPALNLGELIAVLEAEGAVAVCELIVEWWLVATGDRVVRGEAIVAMSPDDMLDGRREQQRRQALRRDGGGELQELEVVGEALELRRRQPPRRRRSGTGPSARDLQRFVTYACDHTPVSHTDCLALTGGRTAGCLSSGW